MKRLIATGTLALLLAAPAWAQIQGSPGLYSNGSSNPADTAAVAL